ncbi:cytochrome P460 family protein [Lysobacter sp. Root494]|uniref:cytochrome P460 family protein n=1 Tax=Lysobacter sp. Root494 TaxID=1736549 RepID=UPI0006F6BFEC|nr:cytochrome P460 family protein [Lysobacter sp. Root494]KQY52270.1 cytochrome P460 [Lysobacter sp. Root494]
MRNRITLMKATIAAALVVLATGVAYSAQDKYSVKVKDGLAFSEFRGYEKWETINVSHNRDLIAVILGNEAMIKAYKAGYPGNGKPFPDGARMAKVHWKAIKNEAAPGQPTVGGPQHDVDFMVKDSKRFADGGGWGYAMFRYDPASKTFRPGTLKDAPPQGDDARCGVACHTAAKQRDYVFTAYGSK